MQLYFLFHQRSKLTLQKPLYFCNHFPDLKKTYPNFAQKQRYFLFFVENRWCCIIFCISLLKSILNHFYNGKN